MGTEARQAPEKVDSFAPAHLKLVRFPSSLAATIAAYVDHSQVPMLAPATLAALPSTRAIANRDVFYVGIPVSSIPRLKQ